MLELVLAFVVLWFCFDYLNLMIQRKIQPKGFDIEHTYMIEIGIKEEYKELYHSLTNRGQNDSLNEIFVDNSMRIVDILKRESVIENVCFSSNSMPYGFGNSYYMYNVDSVNKNILTRIVTEEYFDVFKIHLKKNDKFDWNNNAVKQIIIGGNSENQFIGKPINNVLQVKTDSKDTFSVSGYVEKQKYLDFLQYNEIVFSPMDRNLLIPYPYKCELSIRVYPSEDINFIEKFSKEISQKLEVGPYYCIDINSYQQQKEALLIQYGFTDNFKNILFIVLFIITNVFLGVFGTFWVRTQNRNLEIGLRCAIGSSKKQINSIIIGEALIILITASIPASVIALIFSYFDVVKNLGIPSIVHSSINLGIIHYLINYLATISILSIIILISTYFPAQYAMKIEPSKALKGD